jgi:SnoaL-like domain
MLKPEDQYAISETLSMHGHIFDAGQLDRLDEIFTPEVVYDMSAVGIGVFKGIGVVQNAAARMGDQGPIAHHVTNVVIDSDEDDVVTARSKGLMLMADGTIESVNHLDTLHRHNGEWRISRRIISPVRNES